ncbi:universal stress protein family protein [Zea mays]|uniref:Universal stress protein family protein n=1 Tax=Zea mays TaxID=4577 RepID=K7UZG9_MAIZE|nr:universal stress protein family protein [Zea mays]AQK93631.1 Universal stress protein family protein [Zea mays]|eukprot:NP_001150869.2 universal stress protein family protein [Zea mays]
MGSSGGSCEHFLGQLSSSDGGSAPHQLLQREWDCGTGTGSRRGSRRWSRKKGRARGHRRGGGFCRTEEAAAASRKRVVVVVDQSSGAKHAMMWALTHVANRGDFLTLLHVLPPHSGSGGGGRGAGEEDASALANSLGALCKACKPEVEVEALVIQGPKLSTILSQVKKLEASVLVLSQRKPSPFCCFLRSRSSSEEEELVEECINRAECLTLAVRRRSKGVGGYLVSTRWQKNFWLLA